jgi:hypothetical protein
MALSLFSPVIGRKTAPMQQLEELLRKYNRGTCTEEERIFVEQWYQFFDLKKSKDLFSEEELLQLQTQVWLSVKDKIAEKGYKAPVRQLHPSKKIIPAWLYTSAAAVVLLIAGTIIYDYFSSNRPVIKDTAPIAVAHDAPPGVSKAMLVMDGGRKVTLDSISAQPLLENDGTTIDKRSGLLVYNGTGASAKEVYFNTLIVPPGGEYQLILSDGTKVWMNAASSLRFPTRFIAKERVVELNGEAYFEVTKNAKMPFKVVTSQKMTVEALGTKFDVMAYEDEISLKAALAEGSVRVSNDDNNSVLLSPNQLAEWEQGKSRMKVKEADLDKILAWKNGMIEFGEDDLSSIMRQLSRWYDVQVRFGGKTSGKRYSGSIRRQSKLSQVLAILKEAGVECRLEGKMLIVDP